MCRWGTVQKAVSGWNRPETILLSDGCSGSIVRKYVAFAMENTPLGKGSAASTMFSSKNLKVQLC